MKLCHSRPLDEKHANNPEPGDYWQDHMVGVCVVIAVDDMTVRTCRKKLDCDGGWTFDYNHQYLETREEFRKWLSYGSIAGYWASVTPGYLCDDLDEALNTECETTRSLGLTQQEPVQHRPQRVVCAALRLNSGEMIVGVRHFCPIMQAQINQNLLKADMWKRAEQGFVDQYGQFLTREDAWRVAEAEGQIIRRVGGDGNQLFSENLY